jgi:hypothetical protein
MTGTAAVDPPERLAAPAASAQKPNALSLRVADVVAFAALAALYAGLLWYTWHRWGDVVVDCGRDAYLAMRVAGGDVLYRDITSQYPPLAPYVNAWLLRLFGTHLDVLYASGMVSTALVIVLVYRIGRRSLSVPAAAATAGLLLLTCGFGSFLFNYIFPPSYSGLYGLVSGLFAILYLLRAWESDRSVALIVAGVWCGLAWLSKLESGLAASGAAMAVCAARNHRQTGMRWPGVIRDILCVALPATFVIGVCAAWFWSQDALAAAWFDNIFPAGRIEYWNERFFRARIPSLAMLGVIIGDFGWVLAAAAVAGGAIGALALVLEKRVASIVTARAIVFATVGLLALWGPFGAIWARSGLTGLRWAPLGAGTLLAWSILRIRRGQDAGVARLALVLSVFTLGMLARWGFVIHEYSREYSAPTVILLGVLLVQEVTRATLKPVARAVGRPVGFPLVGGIVALMVALHGYAVSGSVLGLYPFRVHRLQTAHGEIYTDPDHGRVFERVLTLLGRLPPEAELFVIPEEGLLNFLLGLRSRVRYSTLIPGMLMGRDEQEAFIRHLYEEGPDYIVMSDRRFPEFGIKEGFSVYNPLVAKWIRQNSVVVERVEGAGYSVEILGRVARPRPTMK